MRRFAWLQPVVLGLVLPAAAAANGAAARPHVVSEERMTAAVDEAAARSTALRESIAAVLARPETARLASDLGVNASEAAAAVAALEGPELERLAAQARLVDDCLAGGDRISVETTTLIIGLLALIIVILLVK